MASATKCPILYEPTLQKVTLHAPQPARRIFYASIFGLLWAAAIGLAVQTAGQPYAAAVIENARLDALANATNATNATASSKSPPAVASTDPFDDEQVLSELAAADINASAANASDTNSTKSSRPLPHEWLPSALACVCLFFAMTSHALFYLLCHWSVSFRAKVFFSPATKVAAGCHVHFVPMAHKGKQALVPLARSPRTGELTCEFQRQRYSHKSADDAKTAAAAVGLALDGPTAAADAIVLVRGYERRPRKEIAGGKGLATADAAAAARESYGPNILAAPTPRFIDLYIEQLLSPLAVFQVGAILAQFRRNSAQFRAILLTRLPPRRLLPDLLLGALAARRRLDRLHRLPGGRRRAILPRNSAQLRAIL